MGSRIRSPLGESDSMLLPRGIPSENGDRPPHNRNGLKRKTSLRDSWKRKLLALPPQKREEARQKSLKRSPLKRESKGHKAELAKYNASAKAFFEERPNCEICIRLREDGDDILLRPATERHHKFGRIGRLLNWKPGWMASCFHHQTFPHDHPARARRLGLLCEAREWNIFPG